MGQKGSHEEQDRAEAAELDARDKDYEECYTTKSQAATAARDALWAAQDAGVTLTTQEELWSTWRMAEWRLNELLPYAASLKSMRLRQLRFDAGDLECAPRRPPEVHTAHIARHALLTSQDAAAAEKAFQRLAEVHRSAYERAVMALLRARASGVEASRKPLLEARLLSAEKTPQAGSPAAVLHCETDLPEAAVGTDLAHPCHKSGPADGYLPVPTTTGLAGKWVLDVTRSAASLDPQPIDVLMGTGCFMRSHHKSITVLKISETATQFIVKSCSDCPFWPAFYTEVYNKDGSIVTGNTPRGNALLATPVHGMHRTVDGLLVLGCINHMGVGRKRRPNQYGISVLQLLQESGGPVLMVSQSMQIIATGATARQDMFWRCQL